jgi:hypothetical protein
MDQGTQNVTPLGVTFTDGATNTLVKPTQIVFTFNLAATFIQATFNGYQIAETGISPATITGFLIDPATNLPGFGVSRVTLDPTDVFANFQGLTFTRNNNVTLDIFTAAPAVPEASTTVSFGLLLALGMGGVVVAAKRKRAQSAL